MVRWNPPSYSKCCDAIGDTGDADLQAALDFGDGTDADIFRRLGEPKEGDWLSQHRKEREECGETVADYAHKIKIGKYYEYPTVRKNRILLCPIGESLSGDLGQLFLKRLHQYCAAFYDGMRVDMLEAPLPLKHVKCRTLYGHAQYLVDPLYKMMRGQGGKDVYCRMGITLEDIYVEGMEHVHGETEPNMRVGICSLARQSPLWTLGEVVVQQDFQSFCEDPKVLKEGLQGAVADYDDDGDASIRFKGMSDEVWVLQRDFAKLKFLYIENGKLRTGFYRVLKETLVQSGIDRSSNAVARLSVGTVIEVRELEICKDSRWIRARIEQPAGWISLENRDNGMKWAVPVQGYSASTCEAEQLSIAEKICWIREAQNTMVHEIGHLLGMCHCAFFHCIMNGWANPEETAGASFFCPVCLRKFMLSQQNLRKFSLRLLDERYERMDQALHALVNEHCPDVVGDDLAWLERRRKQLAKLAETRVDPTLGEVTFEQMRAAHEQRARRAQQPKPTKAQMLEHWDNLQVDSVDNFDQIGMKEAVVKEPASEEVVVAETATEEVDQTPLVNSVENEDMVLFAPRSPCNEFHGCNTVQKKDLGSSSSSRSPKNFNVGSDDASLDLDRFGFPKED